MNAPLLGESRLGPHLAAAVRRDFFQYFHFRIAHQETREGGGHRIAFAPEADQFRERVRLVVDVSGDGRFERLDLSLDRSVIDDEESETSARDIVKSFLADATPTVDVERIAAWIVDIRSRPFATGNLTAVDTGSVSEEEVMDLMMRQLEAGKKVSAWTGQANEPPLAATVSPAFEVFAGDLEACELPLATGHLRIENASADTQPRFVVTLSARPAMA